MGSTISGHVGVVESFIKGEKVKDGKKVDDPDSDKVVVLEAIAKKGAADESDCPKDCNGKVCKNQVRKSIYNRKSKS